MGPCIIMLQHEVMVVDELHNIGPQNLVTVSLCNAVDIYGKKEAGTGEHLNTFNQINKHK